jgi:hypothetical protein
MHMAYQSLKAVLADLVEDQLGVHIQHRVDELGSWLHELWIAEIAITATPCHGMCHVRLLRPVPALSNPNDVPRNRAFRPRLGLGYNSPSRFTNCARD